MHNIGIWVMANTYVDLKNVDITAFISILEWSKFLSRVFFDFKIPWDIAISFLIVQVTIFFKCKNYNKKQKNTS